MTSTVVAGLWRYPVKSMQGGAVDHVDLRADGVDGDRQWGVVDVETGKVLSAKRWPALLEATAALTRDGEVVITLPDGTECGSDDPATHGALSAWLGREVRLTRPSPTGGTPYELTMDPTDDSSEPWDFATPPGSFVDVAHAHLLTTGSLAAMQGARPAATWDVHRFRPTALVATGDDDFVEDRWVGGQLRIGEATLDVFMATPRCAMPGRGQPTHGLERDKSVLTTLRDRHDNNLGVYASVVRPGPISVGDSVVPAGST